jgi:hypothetical protein
MNVPMAEDRGAHSASPTSVDVSMAALSRQNGDGPDGLAQQ